MNDMSFCRPFSTILIVACVLASCVGSPEQRNYKWYAAETLEDFHALLAQEGRDFEITTSDSPGNSYFEVMFRSKSDHFLCIHDDDWPSPTHSEAGTRYSSPVLSEYMSEHAYVQSEGQKITLRKAHLGHCIVESADDPAVAGAELFQCLTRVEPGGRLNAVIPYSEFEGDLRSQEPKMLVFETHVFFCDL